MLKDPAAVLDRTDRLAIDKEVHNSWNWCWLKKEISLDIKNLKPKVTRKGEQV